MIELKAGMRCLLLQERKEAWRMVLKLRWYAIMMYCFPLQDLMGKRPQSLDYKFLMDLSMTWSSYVGVPSLMVMLSSVLYSRGMCGLRDRGLGGFGLVDRMPCWLCIMWPLMVSADSGKYLDALV